MCPWPSPAQPPRPRDILQRPMLILSWLELCVNNKSIHNRRMEGRRKSNQRKSSGPYFFFIKTVPFCKESLVRKTADTGIASGNRFLFSPFYPERFTEISFWLGNNRKRARAGIVKGERGRWLLERQVI